MYFFSLPCLWHTALQTSTLSVYRLQFHPQKQALENNFKTGLCTIYICRGFKGHYCKLHICRGGDKARLLRKLATVHCIISHTKSGSIYTCICIHCHRPWHDLPLDLPVHWLGYETSSPPDNVKPLHSGETPVWPHSYLTSPREGFLKNTCRVKKSGQRGTACRQSPPLQNLHVSVKLFSQGMSVTINHPNSYGTLIFSI